MSESLETQLLQRRETLKRLAEKNVEAYPYSFLRTHSVAQLISTFSGPLPEHGSDEVIRTAGRVMTLRDMGKSCFATIADGSDRLQVYVKKDVVGEAPYQLFQKDMDLGDFLGVEGTMFRTRTNELSIRVTSLTLLAKSLRPLPEKFHGLKDVETRYREREMDLASNPEILQLFVKRSKMMSSIRKTFSDRGFLEVETPLLQSHAAARRRGRLKPITTRWNPNSFCGLPSKFT